MRLSMPKNPECKMAVKIEPFPNPDYPREYRRFVEIARELGVDESPDALDWAFEKVIGRSSADQSPKASSSKSAKAPVSKK